MDTLRKGRRKSSLSLQDKRNKTPTQLTETPKPYKFPGESNTISTSIHKQNGVKLHFDKSCKNHPPTGPVILGKGKCAQRHQLLTSLSIKRNKSTVWGHTHPKLVCTIKSSLNFPLY